MPTTLQGLTIVSRWLKLCRTGSFIHSFIQAISIAPLQVHYYSEALLTQQLWVKDLPKVATWRLEWESNPWPFGRKASTLPVSHTPHRLEWSSMRIRNCGGKRITFPTDRHLYSWRSNWFIADSNCLCLWWISQWLFSETCVIQRLQISCVHV